MIDFNCIVICGKVDEIELAEVGDVEKKPYTRLKICVARKTSRGMDFTRFNVRAYGDIGADMYQRVKKDDRILVEGPVHSYAYLGDDRQLRSVMMVYANKWMPDQIKKEIEGLEDTVINGRKKKDPLKDGYGDNTEMLFGGGQGQA